MISNHGGHLSEKEQKTRNPGLLSVCILASGSKGNAIYVDDGVTAVLIDAGLPGVQIQNRMRERGLLPEKLNAILVSHEHIDHVRGVGVLARRYDLPVYISARTLASAAAVMGAIESITHFDCGREFEIGSLRIHPFSVSHDAEDPAGFTLTGNNSKIGIATDLGVVTGLVKQHLQECRLLVLEANHDPEMLIKGPYPWHLKQRIKGRTGHLSNEEAMALVAELENEQLEHIVLAHLSAENNTPEKALQKVGEAVLRAKARISVAVQDQCSPIFKLRD